MLFLTFCPEEARLLVLTYYARRQQITVASGLSFVINSQCCFCIFPITDWRRQTHSHSLYTLSRRRLNAGSGERVTMGHPEREIFSDENWPKIVRALVNLCAGTLRGGVRFSITARGKGAEVAAQAPVLEGIKRLFMRIIPFRPVLMGGRGKEGGAMASGQLYGGKVPSGTELLM